ncbi:MAG: hypothetical protein DLM72_16615 [Candidatus Nitrosopolaris wilkensis]|nr:MAG: hypothetical protein DLM72_16615 [Candidatus Nitrosopolaris wilkensis]
MEQSSAPPSKHLHGCDSESNVFDQLVFIFAKNGRKKKSSSEQFLTKTSYPATIANIPQYEFVIFTVQT